MQEYAILSDLHGNLQALQEVHKDMINYHINGVILLGDLINYGMQSNEVLEYLQKEMGHLIVCNIWGNHEKAIMSSDFSRFSSQRGVDAAIFTDSVLSKESREYLDKQLIHDGYCTFDLQGKKCLALHGSIEDYFWKSLSFENIQDSYSDYDFVFSGHSHISHMFTKFYKNSNQVMRNYHSVLFINPGSVGQPRNHHPEAQYAILNLQTMAVHMRSVPYNIKKAQTYYTDNVDLFYKNRLSKGI